LCDGLSVMFIVLSCYPDSYFLFQVLKALSMINDIRA
jgi:hypothetical protein